MPDVHTAIQVFFTVYLMIGVIALYVFLEKY